MPAGEVHIWRVTLAQPADRIAQWAQILAPDEQARAHRFHFEPDRQRFIAGRAKLRALLAGYLGCAASELQFNYGPHGKPALKESFEKGRLCFNMAHSGALAGVALVRDHEIGIDLEQIQPITEMAQIARQFFAPQEQAALLALPPNVQQEAFFNGWTRKEAYLKALGDGLARPLDQFCVSLAPGEPARLLSINGNHADASQWWVEAFSPAPGYAAAVAIMGQGWRFNYWDASQFGA